MTQRIVVGDMVNKVSFNVDLSSYKRALKAVDNIKKKMKELNKPLSATPALAKSNEFVKQARENQKNAEAHVEAFKKNKKKEEADKRAWQEALSKERLRDAKIQLKKEAEQLALSRADSHVAAFKKNQKRVAAEEAKQLRQRETREVRADVAMMNLKDLGQRTGLLGTKEYKRQQAIVKELAREYANGTIRVERFRQGVEASRRALRDKANSTQTLTDKFKNLRSTLIGLTATMTAFSAGAAIIDTSKAFQQIEIGMSTVFGEEVSKGNIEFLRSEADRLGVVTKDLGKDFMKLTVAARNSNLTLDQQKELFTAMSESALVYGLSTEQTSLSLKAFIQMISKGTVNAEELKQQLGDHLPGALSMAAKAAGVTEKEFLKMMENGEVIADELIPKMTKVMREMVAPGIQKAQKSLIAQQGRMTEQFHRLQLVFSKGGFEIGVARLFEALAGLMQKLQPLANFLGRVFGKALNGISLIIDLLSLGIEELAKVFVHLDGKVLEITAGILMFIPALALTLKAIKFLFSPLRTLIKLYQDLAAAKTLAAGVDAIGGAGKTGGKVGKPDVPSKPSGKMGRLGGGGAVGAFAALATMAFGDKIQEFLGEGTSKFLFGSDTSELEKNIRIVDKNTFNSLENKVYSDAAKAMATQKTNTMSTEEARSMVNNPALIDLNIKLNEGVLKDLITVEAKRLDDENTNSLRFNLSNMIMRN